MDSVCVLVWSDAITIIWLLCVDDNVKWWKMPTDDRQLWWHRNNGYYVWRLFTLNVLILIYSWTHRIDVSQSCIDCSTFTLPPSPTLSLSLCLEKIYAICIDEESKIEHRLNNTFTSYRTVPSSSTSYALVNLFGAQNHTMSFCVWLLSTQNHYAIVWCIRIVYAVSVMKSDIN